MRHSKRHVGRRKGPHWEVSQFASSASIIVAAGTGITAPAQGFLKIIGQDSLQRLVGSPTAVINAGWRGIAVKEVVYNSDFALVQDTIAAVTAFSRVSEAVFADPYSTTSATLPTSAPTYFSAEVGSLDQPELEVGAGFLNRFPNRTLYRRWGLYPVGAFNFGGAMQMKYFEPSNFGPRTIKRRVYLKDNDALWAGIAVTNPTLVELTYAWMVSGVIVWRIVQ